MATQVTLDSAKFERLFTSIERQMIMQSSFLESIYNIQTYQLDLDKEREETRRRELDLLRMGMGPTQENPTPAPRPDTEETAQAAAGGFEFPDISTMGLLGGGLAIALAGPITDFLSGAIGRALENAGVSTDFASNMANALGQAGAWATIGSVFGKKAAMWFGVAGAASSIFSDEIGRAFDTNKDGVATAFGVELSPEAVTGIGTAMGLGATAMLRYGPIQSKLLMGVSMLMTAYGDDAAKWLEDQTGIPADFSSPAIDAFTLAAYGASLGSMFGPIGAIVGGIAGFAISVGNTFYDWIKAEGEENRAKNLARMQKEFEDAKIEYETGNTVRGAESMAQTAMEDILEIGAGSTDAVRQERVTTAIEAMKTTDPQRATDLQRAYDNALNGIITQDDVFSADRNFVEDEFIKVLESYLASGVGMGYIDQYSAGGDQAVSAKNMIMGESFAVEASPVLGEDRINAILDAALSNNGIMPAQTTQPIISGLSATEQRIIAAAQQIKQPELLGGGGRPTFVSSNNNGNVTRGGDTNVSHTTNIYGVTPAKALNEGNSVPRPYYANQ
jgi:hypothetical protein